MEFSDSPLAALVCPAPRSNHYGPRGRGIDTVTVHCYVGQVSAERAAKGFSDPKKGASCNYAIGYDGEIALIVEERNASACSSNEANDRRAVTVEVASDSTPPYAVTEAAYSALIELLVDICRRNGIERLLWEGDPALIGQTDRQNMTVHRWFAKKSCPGDWLYSRHGELAARVNERLREEEDRVSYEEWKAYWERWRRERGELPPSPWAEGILTEAAARGITDGTRPRDLVTREEAAAMALKGGGGTVSPSVSYG